jgi:hypothetical protein
MIWILLHFMHKKLQTYFVLKKIAYRFYAFIWGRKQKKLKENKYDMVNIPVARHSTSSSMLQQQSACLIYQAWKL